MSNFGNPDLIQQLNDLAVEGDRLIRELAKQGDLTAQANYSYYVQKTKTAFKMKNEGVAVTFIDTVIKGMPEVAILMREKEIAETRYRATLESINMLKKQMAMLENQIQREWGKSE